MKKSLLLLVCLALTQAIFAIRTESFGTRTEVIHEIYTQELRVYEGIDEAKNAKEPVIALSISATEKDLPSIREFTELQFLYLDKTITTNNFYLSAVQLEALFSILADLPKLHYIRMYDSKLLTYLEKIPDIHGIALENCSWDIFQQHISFFKSLKILKIKDHNLYQISSAISQITSLQQLEIEANNVHSLPTINPMPSLQVLILKLGKVRDIPQSFAKLNNLKFFSLLGGTGFEQFPITLTKLTHLEELRIELRYGKPIPSEIGSLQELRRLYLYDCQRIDSFPATIQNLKKLEYIYLSDTRPSFSIANLNLIPTEYTLVLNRCNYIPIAKELSVNPRVKTLILPSDILPSEVAKMKKYLPNTSIEIKQLH